MISLSFDSRLFLSLVGGYHDREMEEVSTVLTLRLHTVKEREGAVRLGSVVMSFPCLAALRAALGARLGKRHEDFLLLSAAALADKYWPSTKRQGPVRQLSAQALRTRSQCDAQSGDIFVILYSGPQTGGHTCDRGFLLLADVFSFHGQVLSMD